MSAPGSPMSNPSKLRKPAQPSQRKILQEPPGPLNASQASQFQSSTQSPSRSQSPTLNANVSQGVPADLDVQSRDEPESEDVEPEVNMAKEDDNEVQVPSIDRNLTTPASKSSGARTVFSSERDTSPAQTSEEHDSDQELEDFDMEDFQKRYYEELCAINVDEQDLLRKFDRFSDVIFIFPSMKFC